MVNLPELFVLRHGQTEWNAEGRFQGQLDSPLTEMGLAQARAQNAILRNCLPSGGVSAVVSTAGRARHTADLALDGIPLCGPIRFEPDLQEIDFGAWQGLTSAEMEAGWPEVMAAADPDLWQFHAPGGETLDQMAARIEAVLQELSGPTVVVTHGLTSRILRCLALGLDPARLVDLPGGQGNVHHIKDGRARVLVADNALPLHGQL